jgi:ATP-binding cassette, subfamily B, bacterial
VGPPLQIYWHFLRRYLAPQQGAVARMAVLLVASTALQVVAPQMARAFIDAAQVGADVAVLTRAAVIFIGVAALQQAMKVLAAFGSSRVAWSATNALRADLAAHLLRLDLSFHNDRTPGELIERVDGDVNALANFFSSFVVELAGSSLLVVGVLAAIYREDVRAGLALTFFVALALMSLNWLWQHATPLVRESREHSATFYGYLGEVIGSTEDIRSSGAASYALRGLIERLRSWLPVQRRAEVRGNAVWLLAIVLFALADALAYGLGGGLYRRGDISLGAVYMLVAYAAMLAQPIETIRDQLQHLQQAHAGMARVQELLERRSRIESGTERLPDGPLAVDFKRVSFGYDDLRAKSEDQGSRIDEVDPQPALAHHLVLDDISFSLAPGKVLGLLGRTGSGKTTIARLLFRLCDPQAGDVRLGGVSLRRASLTALRARVGLVTQEVQIFEATLCDNITFFDPAISKQRVLRALETLGLGPWLARLPRGLDTPISSASLSAGEAQLIAFARVFIKDPGLVILDEASSRLDPATEALLERAVDRLLAGRTAIVIAHRLATLERADDILVLDRGRIREHGRREDLARQRASRFAELRRLGAEEVRP